MFAIVQAAGWPIWPLILCSIVALALVCERWFSLRSQVVCPLPLLEEALSVVRGNSVNAEVIQSLHQSAPLGQVLAAGLKAGYRLNEGRTKVAEEAMEEIGRVIAHELNRFIPAIATIATIAPLLGLLGTVVGMIEIFAAQLPGSTANPAALAHGISVALYNTAFGLIVAIPSSIAYRYFRTRVDDLIIDLEQAATRLSEQIEWSSIHVSEASTPTVAAPVKS